jgi:hypothetical protein
MQRIHRDVLPALERGDGKKYAQLRCVEPGTIAKWKASSEVMSAIDGTVDIDTLEHFQPSHAETLARAFRKRQKPHAY